MSRLISPGWLRVYYLFLFDALVAVHVYDVYYSCAVAVVVILQGGPAGHSLLMYWC